MTSLIPTYDLKTKSVTVSNEYISQCAKDLESQILNWHKTMDYGTLRITASVIPKSVGHTLNFTPWIMQVFGGMDVRVRDECRGEGYAPFSPRVPAEEVLSRALGAFHTSLQHMSGERHVIECAKTEHGYILRFTRK